MATKTKGRLRFDNGAIFRRKYESGRSAYFIEFYDRNNKRTREIVRNATSFEEAKLALDRRTQQELDRKNGITRQREPITFAEFTRPYEEWTKTNKLSWQTEMPRIAGMRKFFKGMMLHEITKQDCERYKTKRTKKVKRSTVNRCMVILSRIFALAIEWDYLKENPCRGVGKFSEAEYVRNRVMSEAEEEQFYRVLEQERQKAVESKPMRAKHYKRLGSMVRTFIHTGLRKQELLGLKWQDIDFEHGRILIRKTKSQRARTVSMNETVRTELVKLFSPHNAYVFTNPESGTQYKDIKRAFTTICDKAGIENLWLHDLRRTCGTRLLKAGTDIVTVKTILGHRDITTTLRYTVTNEAEMQNAVFRLDVPKQNRSAPMWPAFQKMDVSEHSQKAQYQWN